MAKDDLRVSVKQLEMAHACPRKWAYHYLEGVPQVDGEARVVGNAVHHDMKMLLTGGAPKHGPETFVGKMCRELLPFAQNTSGRHVSEIIKVVRLPEYGLRVDLRADYLDRPLLKDWKTTGAPRPNAKLPNGKFWAPQSLEKMWQPNIYAFLLMRDHWPGTEAVHAEWVFVSKKFGKGQTPRVWPLRHTFTFEAAKQFFETYAVPTADLIRSMRAAWDARQLDSARLVPHNAPSCERRGNFCDAAGHCGMVSSPMMSYEQLHLPVLQEKEA